jgi:DNA polymerase-3 subunit epsilon
MPLLRDCRFSAIDFESAGTQRGGTDSPVQIGIACWSATHGHHEPFVSYLHTAQPVTWSAQKVHGITAEQLKDAPSLISLWPEVRNRLDGAVVVAHGKGTEKRFLRAFPGHGFGPWIDTLTLARALDPGLPEHSLGALCRHHGLEDAISAIVCGRTWHDALFDAVASLALLEFYFVTRGLLDFELETILQPDCSAWHQFRNS